MGTEEEASESSSPRSYSIRILPRALDEIDQAVLRLEDLAGEEIAREWRAGLRAELTRLVAPREHPIIPEAGHFARSGREIRHLIYRRTTSSVAHRVLFVVSDAGEDGPTVTVFHVRHASRRPIAAAEARQLREELQG